MGVSGQSSQWGPGVESLVTGKPPEADTFSFWTFNGGGKFAYFTKIWKHRQPQIFALSRQKGHYIIIIIAGVPLTGA